ncbi:uncharacterized protein METZ01_LOCUS479415 [marine metagenome]|uniref:Uncharacterized protein n=1 Tax=marine metagenome TaxID=408172 RepID=A0A383C306_9ZZZZ
MPDGLPDLTGETLDAVFTTLECFEQRVGVIDGPGLGHLISPGGGQVHLQLVDDILRAARQAGTVSEQ